MLRKMRGVPGIEVHLIGGVRLEGAGEDQTVAYEKLDELYLALGRAIAIRTSAMSGAEVRFLRKRLEMSQSDLGSLGGKTGQVAAKWEKDQLPMPRAEASLLRLCWLQRFFPSDLSLALEAFTAPVLTAPVGAYLFQFDGSWTELRGLYRTEAVRTTGSAVPTQQLMEVRKVGVRAFLQVAGLALLPIASRERGAFA